MKNKKALERPRHIINNLALFFRAANLSLLPLDHHNRVNGITSHAHLLLFETQSSTQIFELAPLRDARSGMGQPLEVCE